MSKAISIQKKLWKAYGKVAKVLGVYTYEIYRSSTIDTPIQDIYVIDTRQVSFSQDEKYSGTDKSGVSGWLCWVDGNLEDLFNIQKGDYLHSLETGETYYIASATDHLYLQAVKANNVIEVSRVGYGDTGSGFSTDVPTIVASSVPCDILQPSSGGSGGYIPVSTYSRDALPSYEIYLSDLANEVKIRDVITDEFGNKSQVLVVYNDDLGTKLITQAMEP